MAFAQKYTYDFYSLKEYSSTSHFRIKIYLEGYGGGVTNLGNIEANSITVNRGGDLLTNVQGTKLSFTIYNSTEAEFKEFRNAAYGDYKIELIQDPDGTPQTKFIGYNQSEIYTEPYELEGKVAVEWTCGLSHLKHVRWDASGVLHTGQKTLIEIIRLATNLLPTPVDIREFVNIYEDSITSATTDSMLNQIVTDSRTYKEIEEEGGNETEVAFFCYDVLTAVLAPFNAHMFHWDGIWYIVRPQEYLDSTMYFRQFIPRVGSESTVTVDSTGNWTTNSLTVSGVNGLATELVLPTSSAEIAIEPALNRVAVTYNMDNLDVSNSDLIKNGSFNTYTWAALGRVSPTYWTVTGSDVTTYTAIWIGAEEKFFRFEPVAQAAASAINTGVHISQQKDNLIVSTSDSMQFSFDAKFNVVFRLIGTPSSVPYDWITNDMTITFDMEIKMGTYYLVGNEFDGFVWQLGDGYATFKKTGFQALSSGLFTFNTENFMTFNSTLPTLPESGQKTFSIKIFRPYTNYEPFRLTVTASHTGIWENIWIRNITMTYLPNEEPPVSELITYSKIIEDENLLELELLHGDGGNSITLNSFRLLSDFTITDIWTRRGAADNAGIVTVLLRQLRDLRGDFIRMTNAKLIGEVNAHNTIIDSTDVSTEYMISDYSWMVESGEWDVNMMEIKTFGTVTTISTSTSLAPVNETVNTVDGGAAANPPESTMMQPASPVTVSQTNTNNY